LLIHAVVGMGRICGALLVLNHSGKRASAASSVAARSIGLRFCEDVVDDGWGVEADPGMAMSVVVAVDE